MQATLTCSFVRNILLLKKITLCRHCAFDRACMPVLLTKIRNIGLINIVLINEGVDLG